MVFRLQPAASLLERPPGTERLFDANQRRFKHRFALAQLPQSRHQQSVTALAALKSPQRTPHHQRIPSRGFLPWRFADAGPAVRGTTFMGAGIRKPSHQPTSASARARSAITPIVLQKSFYFTDHVAEMKFVEQLTLVTLQTAHHRSTSPRFASTQRNHACWPVSTDFCNKICQEPTSLHTDRSKTRMPP
jgi:hypothetical protein